MKERAEVPGARVLQLVGIQGCKIVINPSNNRDNGAVEWVVIDLAVIGPRVTWNRVLETSLTFSFPYYLGTLIRVRTAGYY